MDRQKLKRCPTSRKAEGSRLEEVNELFPIYLTFPATLGPGVYSASNRNGYQKQKDNICVE
jgi:hypothetical protein